MEAEVRDALRIRQRESEPGLFFELTYLDPTSLTDFLAVLDLLDYVRQGFFDMIHIVPSASTWSRSRHSEHSGQPPLRSRSSPLGLPSLSPGETDQINRANRALEVAVWVAEQSLQCPSKFVGLNIIFPEDLGGHCEHGPSSMWVLREFRFLEGIREARRAAAYMCQFTRSEYERPTGILSNCTFLRPLLFLGWPNLVEVQNNLTYRGPLPLSCSCGHEHAPLIGLTDDATFRTTNAVEFGADFWTSCVYDDILERSFVSLKDGDLPGLTPLGDSPLLSPFFSLCFDFATVVVRSVESWYPYEGIFWWTSLLLILLRPTLLLRTVLLSALLLVRVCARFGRCSRFPLLLYFRTAPLLALLPRLRRSVHCARARSPCRMKRPLVLLRPRGDVSSAVTDAR